MNRNIAAWIRERRGMTLVELMIAVAVFGVLMGVVMGFMVQSRRSYSETRDRAQIQQSMRAVLSLLTAEIRSAGCDPLSAGFDTFGIANATLLQARMDLNGDADFTDNNPDETVTYSFDAGAGELSRDDGSGAQVVLRNLTNAAFTYFDQNDAPLAAVPLNATDRARVRTVRVQLQAEAADGEQVTYETRIALRNI
ncbi:MAG TPA: prepilin-type N-terminal cleavage/methylation domain-containing protein [Candidatus Krumholzibacteria bacterium]|nr:prepilin-type N-terminal cleavage/methylation domain-containing protein [Candidatus Krumholzibacteria bacterium]